MTREMPRDQRHGTRALTKAAEVIEEGISRTLNTGYRTADIAGQMDKVATTTEMTDIILRHIEEVINEQALGVFTL